MQHSQTGAVYPSSPFVYDYNRMDEVFGAKSQEFDRNSFLMEVASVGVEHCTEVNDNENSNENSNEDNEDNRDTSETYRLKEMLKYISEITLDQLNQPALSHNGTLSEGEPLYTDIRYFRTDQTLDSSDHRYRLDRDGRITKQLWLNFHTLAYECTKNSNIIDSEMREVVSWCIVPIIGNVRPTSTETLVYSDLLNQEIKLREARFNTERKSANRSKAESQINGENDTIVDCASGSDMVNQRLQRFATRNFVKRITETKEVKIDSITDRAISATLPAQIIRPNKNQFTLSKNTRANAQNIRESIMSQYKQNRLRQVPQMRDVHRSIDLRIRNGSDKLASAHNNAIMSRVRFIDLGFSDYRLDDVIVSKLNSVWKFTPISSGRIILDLSMPEYEIPAGEQAYYRKPEPKKSAATQLQSYVEKPREIVVVPKKPDIIGPVPVKNKEENAKVTRVGKRQDKPTREVQKIKEVKREKPYWMAKKSITKADIDAANAVIGDQICSTDNGIAKKKRERPAPAIQRPQIDKVSRSKNRSTGQSDLINDGVHDDEYDNTKELKSPLPDIAFVTVAKVGTILCLTLNCLTITNLVD